MFDAYKYYPAMWDECIELAKIDNFDYIAFNGVVFSVYVPDIVYDKRICDIEDLTGTR